jgi:hypothetical protein
MYDFNFHETTFRCLAEAYAYIKNEGLDTHTIALLETISEGKSVEIRGIGCRSNEWFEVKDLDQLTELRAHRTDKLRVRKTND